MYSELLVFNMADDRYLDFLKSCYFIGQWGPEDQDQSFCKFKPESVKQLWRYRDISFIRNGRRPPSYRFL